MPSISSQLSRYMRNDVSSTRACIQTFNIVNNFKPSHDQTVSNNNRTSPKTSRQTRHQEAIKHSKHPKPFTRGESVAPAGVLCPCAVTHKRPVRVINGGVLFSNGDSFFFSFFSHAESSGDLIKSPRLGLDLSRERNTAVRGVAGPTAPPCGPRIGKVIMCLDTLSHLPSPRHGSITHVFIFMFICMFKCMCICM